MAWRTIAAVAAVMLFLLGCQGSDQATPVAETTSVEQATTTEATTTEPDPFVQVLTAEEKLLRWIRSCEVQVVVFAHGDVAYVKFTKGGGFVRLRVGDDAFRRISEAARKRGRACNKRITVGIE
jgi:ABC-type uncharacterized transport system auxiliary subunit